MAKFTSKQLADTKEYLQKKHGVDQPTKEATRQQAECAIEAQRQALEVGTAHTAQGTAEEGASTTDAEPEANDEAPAPKRCRATKGGTSKETPTAVPTIAKSMHGLAPIGENAAISTGLVMTQALLDTSLANAHRHNLY
ncbi:hypothetical protein JCM1841_006249 [Sporobolomyces salmonicolor]